MIFYQFRIEWYEKRRYQFVMLRRDDVENENDVEDENDQEKRFMIYLIN